jgi:hypothetical protein
MAKKKRLLYPEGTWFAVPLRTGGFAIGLLARVAGDGPAFGYFFGPRWKHPPAVEITRALTPKDAIFVALFGDLGLLNGEWPILGQDLNWNRDVWPLPPFIRIDEIANEAWKVSYSDQLQVLAEEAIDPTLEKKFPRDRLSGYGAVEIRLTQLLEG